LLGARALLNKLAWMLEWGTVDMLLMPGPLPLRRVRKVDRWLDGEGGAEVRQYLLGAVERRQVFTEPRHLLAVVVDLGLAATVISRFARCRAAADGRTEVSAVDVREAIGVGDFLVLGHSAGSQQGLLLRNLREVLLSDRAAYRKLLASEA
jgi:lysine-N-methylase